MAAEIKLKRVILETDDGQCKYLEGEDAQKWDEAMRSMNLVAFVHGRRGQGTLQSLEWLTGAANEIYRKLSGNI